MYAHYCDACSNDECLFFVHFGGQFFLVVSANNITDSHPVKRKLKLDF